MAAQVKPPNIALEPSESAELQSAVAEARWTQLARLAADLAGKFKSADHTTRVRHVVLTLVATLHANERGMLLDDLARLHRGEER